MDDGDLQPLRRVATDKTGQEVVVRSILLRDLTQEHLERMVELLQVVFDGWPAFDPGVPPVDHLRWKIETPFAGVAAIAAEIEGELVGSATVFTLQAKVGDREFPANAQPRLRRSPRLPWPGYCQCHQPGDPKGSAVTKATNFGDAQRRASSSLAQERGSGCRQSGATSPLSVGHARHQDEGDNERASDGAGNRSDRAWQ